MLQIDGSTGKLGISPYNTYTMCYNNEDFRRIYFKYADIIPNFVTNSTKKNRELILNCQCEFKPARVRFISPELENEVNLSFDYNNGNLQIDINEDLFVGYGLIDMIKE